jgi:hypothetical protein
LSGTPTWVEQGPATLVAGEAGVAPNDNVSGALESIAVNPNNPAQILVGTANGGVWRTTNADPNNPAAISWTPLTDQLPSLAIGAVAYDASDASGNTFYAGTGRWSSGGDGGLAVGLYKTTDAGAHWTQLGATTLAGHRVKALVVNGPTLLAGTIDGVGDDATIRTSYKTLGGGLFRSTDGGTTFAQVVGNGLPAGAVPSLLPDPGNPRRVYAAVIGTNSAGVFRSDDAGATWTAVNTGLADPTTLAGVADIELTAQNVGGTTTLFAGLARDKTILNVYTSGNGGAGWTVLAAPPADLIAGAGGGFNEYFQLEADPVNAGVVYLEGGFGNVCRYVPSGAGSWLQKVGPGTKNNTGPHADSRDLKFLGTGTLLESDDGGIAFLPNPADLAANEDWGSFNGNLATLELYSAAYDPTNHVLAGAAQDNAFPYQDGPNSPTWTAFGGGDVLRYAMGNNLKDGDFQRFRFDGSNAQVDAAVGAVTGATVGAGGTLTVTSPGHGLQTGDEVQTGKMTGLTGSAGIWTVTRVDANHFSLNGSKASGTFLGSGPWRREGFIATLSGPAGSPIVVTTSAPHGLHSGDLVVLAGTGTPVDNSSFRITVTDATHFSLNGTSASGSTTTTPAGANWSPSNVVLLSSGPGAAPASGLNPFDYVGTAAAFTLNAVDPNRMLLGYFKVYEDNGSNHAGGYQAGDVIADITANVGTLTDVVTAVAYGGFRAGTGQANVAFVATRSGQLFFRGETGTSFASISPGVTGVNHTVYSIVLDPQDWRRVYVVKDDQLFFTPDVTNLTANPFRVLGGGGNDNLGQQTSEFRSVALVAGAPVVGALGGVFRLTTSPDATTPAVWAPLGQGLPHAVVKDVRYDARDDLLTAATFGRGAWALPDATGANPPTMTPPTTPPATQPPPGTPPPTVSAPQVVRARRTGAVQALVLAFSEALDAASATSLTHYQLVISGKGRKGKPRVVPLLGAAYDPGAHTVTLTLGRLKSSFKKGMLEVSGITDPAGDVLSGTAVFAVNLQPMKHK